MAEIDYAQVYDPRKVLDDPQFKVLSPGDKPEEGANLAVFYNPNKEIHLVQKPRPRPGPGQVLVHVRATGICGYVEVVIMTALAHSGRRRCSMASKA